MSVSNQTVSQLYVANGSQTTFAIPFAYVADTAETVTKVYLVLISTGAKTLKTISTDYTLTGDPAANVEFNSAPSALYKVLITREVDFQQIVDYINTGSFLAETHEAAMDRIVLMVQQLKDKLNRAPILNVLNSAIGKELGLGEAGDVMVINDDGDNVSWVSAQELGAIISNLEGALAIVNNLSDLDDVAEALVNLGIAPLSFPTTHSITNSQSATNLTGETFDGTVYKSVEFVAQIVQGTTIVAHFKFSLFYVNGTWQLVEGDSRESAVHGVTFSISQATTVAQLKAAEAGLGNGTIQLKKHYFLA